MIDEKMQCYNELLKSIFNTDYNDDPYGVLCVYDLKNDEKLIAIFTDSRKCAKFLNIKYGSIHSMVSKGFKIRHRFKLIRLKRGWENNDY